MKMWLRSIYYHVPEDVRQGILVKRRSRQWLRGGIVFVHIPKAAGTSINEALFGRFMGHARASDVEKWGSPELKALPSFAVTRNPWDRLVSAYRFAKRGRGVGGARQAWVWRPEQYRIPEFETFERFVGEWLVKRDVWRLDPMFRPQSEFVCDESGNLLVDHLGKLEDLQPTLDFVATTIARSLCIKEANRSGERVDYRDFYTPELINLVGNVYRADVDRFGYGFE